MLLYCDLTYAINGAAFHVDRLQVGFTLQFRMFRWTRKRAYCRLNPFNPSNPCSNKNTDVLFVNDHGSNRFTQIWDRYFYIDDKLRIDLWDLCARLCRLYERQRVLRNLCALYKFSCKIEQVFPANVNFRITAWQSLQYETTVSRVIRHSSDIRESDLAWPFPYKISKIRHSCNSIKKNCT